MGLVYADIILSNPVIPDLIPVNTNCNVDTGSTYLCIPQHLVSQLGLKELYKKEANLAYGFSRLLPYVGPIKVEFENRVCFVGAMVMGDECLLGAIPMEDMDLVVIPKLFQLMVNLESPNYARGKVK